MEEKYKQLQKIVVATKNEGKLQEICELLTDVVPIILSYKDIDWVSPMETGKTFAENAFIKAYHVATTTGLPALADDSGLCITKLNDFPGIFSARWANNKKGFIAAIEKVERELQGANSKAFFCSVISLCFPDGIHFEFEGIMYGNIAFPSQGPIIGYESIFIPDGYSCSLSSLPSKERQKIHYRTLAINKLNMFIKQNFNK